MDKEYIKKHGELVVKKGALMTDKEMTYCPGCSHGTVNKLIGDVIEEKG